MIGFPSITGTGNNEQDIHNIISYLQNISQISQGIGDCIITQVDTTTDQTIANNTESIIIFNTILQNFSSTMVHSGSQFIAKVAGVYSFSLCIQWGNFSSGKIVATLKKNGAIGTAAFSLDSTTAATSFPAQVVAGELFMNVDDYVNATVLQVSGTSQIVQHTSILSVKRV